VRGGQGARPPEDLSLAHCSLRNSACERLEAFADSGVSPHFAPGGVRNAGTRVKSAMAGRVSCRVNLRSSR
jgi:hypothetical protein